MDWRLPGSLASLLYGAALIPLLEPDSWMWRVWVPLWILFTAVAALVAWRGDDPLRPLVPWTASMLFSIVAVMSAIMETRVYDNVGRVFWALGVGMAMSVALFLASYDRSKRPGAEVDA